MGAINSIYRNSPSHNPARAGANQTHFPSPTSPPPGYLAPWPPGVPSRAPAHNQPTHSTPPTPPSRAKPCQPPPNHATQSKSAKRTHRATKTHTAPHPKSFARNEATCHNDSRPQTHPSPCYKTLQPATAFEIDFRARRPVPNQARRRKTNPRPPHNLNTPSPQCMNLHENANLVRPAVCA